MFENGCRPGGKIEYDSASFRCRRAASIFQGCVRSSQDLTRTDEYSLFLSSSVVFGEQACSLRADLRCLLSLQCCSTAFSLPSQTGSPPHPAAALPSSATNLQQPWERHVTHRLFGWQPDQQISVQGRCWVWVFWGGGVLAAMVVFA